MIPQTPTEMLRDVMGTISETCQKMSACAMGLNTEGVKTHFLTLDRAIRVLIVIQRDIMMRNEAVVHCADCAHCMSPERVEHMRPYHKAGNAFYCKKWDMDFFAPDYRAETWFCADGIPRVEGEDGMK